MKPTEAGFDGERGIFLIPPCEEFPEGVLYQLPRGNKKPPEDYDFCNQLVWYMPAGKDATLLYANREGKFFKLDFIPVDKPFD